jgi:exonuclease SbcC
MIPIHLSISGFLSYRDPVDLDFTTFDLACIAGANGAGKSSLLDAITWALFGQARKRDDSIINNQSEAAEVSLIFEYEGNFYRVQRTKPRAKTTLLEFQILQDEHRMMDEESPLSFAIRSSSGTWKPLTERSLRETEARIRETLRLDYETFVNASFFLQGKADLFTQQRPGDRKRILGSILDLDIWETYRQRAAEQRRSVEVEISGIDGRLQEIAAELDEEKTRKSRLKQLEGDLKRLSQEREASEAALANMRQIATTLVEQQKLVDTFARQLEATEQRLDELKTRVDARQRERDEYNEVIAHADQIEAAYHDWENARSELEGWEEVANRFREHESRREVPRSEIHAAGARLEQEQKTLQETQQEIASTEPEISSLRTQIEALKNEIASSEDNLERRERLNARLDEARQLRSDTNSENKRLKLEMDELKERIDKLSTTEGAECPLCGQPLNPHERKVLIEELNGEGTEMGDHFRANKEMLVKADDKVKQLEEQIASLSQVEAELRTHTQTLARLSSRLDHLEGQQTAWTTTGDPRLLEITETLEKEDYAPEARALLAIIDAELKAIGYDAAAHDSARQAESTGRASEGDKRRLENARSTLAPLEREISDLKKQITAREEEDSQQKRTYREARQSLTSAQEQLPDVRGAERGLMNLKEQENRLRLEVGAARQKVLILDDIKIRSKELETQREEFAHRIGQYRQLERAFGKDGIPALLIEQALPQIEVKANEILDRLSDGNMSVRFVTQAQYKDKRRDDLKETLDIQISDSAGTRDYEMYSGGEAFRINFAIRLALSEVLAQRAGARLRTLVIDEGFGSQDAQGRQRLIEAINLVRPDFAKILVITHIEELKDAFPTRIEVVKTLRGSVVQVNY